MAEIHTLREWRKLKDKTILQMAKALNVTPKTYQTWERCPAKIKIGALIDICNALNVEPASIKIFSARDNAWNEGSKK